MGTAKEVCLRPLKTGITHSGVSSAGVSLALASASQNGRPHLFGRCGSDVAQSMSGPLCDILGSLFILTGPVSFLVLF